MCGLSACDTFLTEKHDTGFSLSRCVTAADHFITGYQLSRTDQCKSLIATSSSDKAFDNTTTTSVLT